jgi:adenine-specific DNA methylase
MSNEIEYPKRLIEVDLPIKKISEHARREKSIRHGHISTLHIWWARRPLAACRAVLCAALWPDPVDSFCPERFRIESIKILKNFYKQRFEEKNINNLEELRHALLNFIADFANWDNSTKKEYLDASRALTQVAHESLGGEPGSRPLVVDPFAGGGSIPLEALRIGADTFASDLNPVAVLLNKVVLEYIPKYGKKLADEIRKWGYWMNEEAEKELSEFYLKDTDGATPIAYLWARTIRCEGPGCGAEIPLIRSLWLAKKTHRSIALKLIPNPIEKCVDFQIIENVNVSEIGDGTVKRGSATCPCCGYTTPVALVRKQLKSKCGGTNDARLFCVVTTKATERGRFYRLPTKRDLEAVRKAGEELEWRKKAHKGPLSLVPDEPSNESNMFNNSAALYGMKTWEQFYTLRQLLTITTLIKIENKIDLHIHDDKLIVPIKTCLALLIDKIAQYNSSLCRWKPSGESLVDTFGRQAFPMVWDFAEANVFGSASGDFIELLNWIIEMVTKTNTIQTKSASNVSRYSATNHPLPDMSIQAFITDPPYYYSVQYAGLSDFFYVWLKRSLTNIHKDLFTRFLTAKDEEIIVSSPNQANAIGGKNNQFYQDNMTIALSEGHRIIQNNGISVIVFAQLQTTAWEAFVQSIINAGWVITGSWPIDTEMESRVIAKRQSVLGSSIHIVCRPRKKSSSSLCADEIGNWRDILHELPTRIHEWMPRLKEENVVGADALFASLGPALEIFSRYSQVQKASGEIVTLKEYLEHVWTAVSKEALNMIFEGADATGFEEDSRLTAMWLWTLSTGENGLGEKRNDDLKELSMNGKNTVFFLEYDAVRKIAQGLGVHLEELPNLVEIKGNKARLLPVSDRAKFLFGKEQVKVRKKASKKDKQITLWGEISEKEKDIEELSIDGYSEPGKTILDQVHQSMILFAEGRSEALKRLIIEDNVGNDPRFWKLAQALSALYPKNTDEKRWVDGLMGRKKSLGF